MSSCPSGHHSTDDDFCGVCGLRLRVLSTPPTSLAVSPSPVRARARGSSPEPLGDPCPACGVPRAGRFCEACGYDFVSRSGPPGEGATVSQSVPVEVRWRVVIGADPAYYQYMVDRGMLDPGRIGFPMGRRQRRLALHGERVHIGRRIRSREFVPEIDLGGPEGDPAVSHLHALLLARPDDTWALADLGSTNGTTINGIADPIGHDVEVPLNDSDRIYVGAWTVIILQKG